MSREFVIKGRVTVTGASMTVEANSEAEARRIAEETWDWDYSTSSIADFEITAIIDVSEDDESAS